MIAVYPGVVPYQRMTYLVLSGYVTSSSLPAGVYCAANDANITGTSSTGHIPVISGGGGGDVVIVRYGGYSVVATAAHVIGFTTSGGPTNTSGTVTFSLSEDSSSKPYGFLIGVGTRSGGSTTVSATLSEGSSLTVSGKYLKTAGSDRAVIVPLRIRKYTVSFNANGGTGAPSDVSVAAGGQWTCPSTIPTKSNSNFAGWAESQSATPQEVAYYPGASYSSPSANLILYAVWMAEVGVIIFNTMGGTISSGVYYKVLEAGEQYGELPIPVWGSVSFVGWFTAEIGGTQVYPETQMQGGTNVILYAHYEASATPTYQVFFNADGGTPAPEPITRTDGETIGILPAVTREGFVFLQWTNSADGTAVTAETMVDGADIYAVAVWTRHSSIITFNADGGTGVPATETVPTGSAFGRLPVPEKVGSNFEGWYNEDREKVEASDSASGDETLTARWSDGTVEWFKATKAVAGAGSL